MVHSCRVKMNTLLLFVLGAVFLGAQGAPYRAAEDDIKEYIRLVLENFRQEMPHGIPSLKIPALDPFQFRNQVFDIKNENAEVLLEFPSLDVVGLSTFKADVDFDLGSMGIKVDFSTDHIKGNGEYKLNGKIMKLFPIYGDGEVRLDLQQPRVVAEAQIYLDEDSLSMEITRLDISWKDLKLHLGNFLGQGSLSRVLEVLLPGLGQKLINNFSPQILKGLSDLINKLLAKLVSEKPEIKEILKNIVGG